jgi:hypothetical protein|tara:strand:- start:6 stop:146 length:141 start_codon:yes stop_codon:yes gene_type:complete
MAESQYAILDELEWERGNAKLTTTERDAAVDNLIARVVSIGRMLQA